MGIYPESVPTTTMYNEQVTYDTDHWTYSPIKYWPNETAANTTVDGGGATTTGGADKLSFFAYAPYVDHTTDLGSTGITAFTSNDATGDPKITYTVGTSPATSVDLLWGVIPASTTSYNTVLPDQDLSSLAGKPNLNLIKQEKSETVDFLFKHALSKLRFTIQAAVDQVEAGGTLDASTKIYVNSVTITPSDFHSTGILNLNNTTANEPSWESLSGTLGAISGASLNTAIQSPNAGVETSAKAVFSNTDDGFMLIPETGGFAITINYDIETTDPNLDGGKVTINNIISKAISSQTLAAGKAYTYNLVLGLTSVKVTATVCDWDNIGSTVNLPINE